MHGQACVAPPQTRMAVRARSTRDAPPDLSGKTFLVTGSTDGIGRHTARLLAEHGATVLVHGRSASRVDAAVAHVSAGLQGPVRGYVRDFASLDEVRRLADDVKRDFPEGISCLINNAGVFHEGPEKSLDGYGLTWAVNVLAPFALTAHLLGSVRERIVNVASLSASSRIVVSERLHEARGHEAYSCSKLCNQVFTYELARRLAQAGSPVTCNALDPGTVNTKMLLAGWGPMGIEVEDAGNEFFLATSPSVASVTGKYFVSNRETRSPGVSYDEDVQRKLWEMWERQTGVGMPL